jgi:hypothetical protein
MIPHIRESTTLVPGRISRLGVVEILVKGIQVGRDGLMGSGRLCRVEIDP